MQFDSLDYTIPTWAVTAIYYGDRSGLEPEDEQALDRFFEKEELPENGHWSFGDDEYFTHYPDIGLACTCIDAKYLFPKESV